MQFKDIEDVRDRISKDFDLMSLVDGSKLTSIKSVGFIAPSSSWLFLKEL